MKIDERIGNIEGKVSVLISVVMANLGLSIMIALKIAGL